MARCRFPPAKWGPLSDIDKTGGALVSEFAQGITPAPVVRAFGTTADRLRQMMEPEPMSPVLAGAVAYEDTAGASRQKNDTTPSNTSIVVNYSPTVNHGDGGVDIERLLRRSADELADRIEQRLARKQANRYGAAL